NRILDPRTRVNRIRKMADFKIQSWAKERRVVSGKRHQLALPDFRSFVYFQLRGKCVDRIIVVAMIHDHGSAVTGQATGEDNAAKVHRVYLGWFFGRVKQSFMSE